MKKLDTLQFPLTQNALIEASAGTGKTYTISNLYLRLILGHECQPLNVAQILILTFTNAATAELKDRILARIRKAWRDFVTGASDDSFIQALIDQSHNPEQAQQRLLLASQEMDLGSIFTIHGFCQRVLSEHAFESGATWQETLSLDDSALLKKASSDYWRIRVSGLPEATLRWLLGEWATPEAMIWQIRPVLFRDIGYESPIQLKQQWQQYQQDYDATVEEVRLWWRNEAMSDVLREADLKANVKIAKAAFLTMMADFATGELYLPALGSDGWLTLCPAKISSARKKSSAELDIAAFERFEQLAELESRLSLARQKYFFWDALLFTRQHLQTQKLQNAELSPDDLLSRLYQALSAESTPETEADSGFSLSELLRDKYPVALVDEFQDTDEVQFAIFRHLYNRPAESAASNVAAARALIMIGDPKQAIYSFRGGDIHTYLAARQMVPESSRYTLAVNWRSQPQLVSAVNAVFVQSQSGFKHQDMPFLAVDAGKQAKPGRLNGQPITALSMAILPDALDKKGQLVAHKWGSASQEMAQLCSNQISHYLQHMTIAEQNIKASDICVLVRDRFEAELIQSALRERHIDSVFLRKDSVLKSPVAYSLWLLLRAIAEYKSESYIKAALLDSLFAFSHHELAALNSDLGQWQERLQWFANAFEIWSYQGVMAALEYLFQCFDLYSRIVAHNPEHHRCITDLRHLSEILQFQSGRMDGKAPLINWFEACIASPELLAAEGIEGTQWRLDTDQNLVQICTIHASKGLQYPIVMLPFASRFKDHGSGFYHDDEKGLQYSIVSDETLQEKQQQERLAEDIRLFYVALTRAEYHGWLGIWNNAISPRSGASGFAQTALGSVLDFGPDDAINSNAILVRLQARLAGENVSVAQASSDEISKVNAFLAEDIEFPSLGVRQLTFGIKQDWLLTSYSAISRTRQNLHDSIAVEEELKAADEGDSSTAIVADTGMDDISNIEHQTLQQEMRFAFTKGASAGSYLHEVLEHCTFNNADSVLQQCQEYADKYGVDSELTPEISGWLVETLQTPLAANAGAARLCDIPASHRLPEMEFYLPLNAVDVVRFNQIIKQWLPDLQGTYQLSQLNGMLKGYLDLVYISDGRFYVADYKSNYLGETLEAYDSESMQEAMMHHDYYLQALLYSVALHRYLSNKMAGYQYEKHIGGAQYLFLRGMSPDLPGNGVLTVTPPAEIIAQLDNLFSGKEQAA